MDRLRMALAALAVLMIGATPLAARAQDGGAITKDQRDKGMKDAPALATSAGLTCTVSDAYFLGASTSKDGKVDVYEVACKQGLGYVLLSGKGPVKAYDCLATREQATLACKLPANAKPIESFKTVVSQTGVPCTVKDARFVGSSDTQSVYEASCQEGPGYLLQTPAPGKSGPTQVIPCAAIQSQATHCTLTTQDQVNAYIAGLAAKSGKPCQVSASRYVGSDKTSGDAFYEVACGQGIGFFVSTDKAGAYKTAMDCSQARGLGGCTLTDSTKLAAADSGNYTRLAKAAGFDCDVAKSRLIGLDANKNEVVELACSNRPDGAVGVFPAAAGGQAQVYDCVQAGRFGTNASCTLTSPAPLFAKYSAALAAKNRASCKVSDAHYLGTGTNTTFVETACADGKRGWVMELGKSDSVVSLLSCGQAKALGLSCTLPTNQ